MPLLRQRSIILVKEETTEGVDAGPTATANSLLAYDVQVNPAGERLARDPVRETLSPASILIGSRHYEVTFQTEIYHSGTADVASRLGALLKACGMSETVTALSDVTYKPSSSGHKSATIYIYRDGLLHKLLGCRGTWELICQAGHPARLNWRFLGKYQEPADAAIPTPTLEANALAPPKALAASLTFNAITTFVVQQMQIVLGNTLAIRPDINDTHGVAGIAITNRAGTGSFNPEAVVNATYNFWQDWINSTLRQISAQVGAAAGNKMLITCPKVAVDQIREAEREGVLV
ncbi:MAG: hypothetical protein HYZ89_05485, partial [Candidatus Omnitrophica bacterium]|nr:hypothetical protein [Candidatus Omnitrophota bacterium]